MTKVYGAKNTCNNCGGSWNVYSDWKDSVKVREGVWFAGSKCPTCSVHHATKIDINSANHFEYNVGNIPYNIAHERRIVDV